VVVVVVVIVAVVHVVVVVVVSVGVVVVALAVVVVVAVVVVAVVPPLPRLVSSSLSPPSPCSSPSTSMSSTFGAAIEATIAAPLTSSAALLDGGARSEPLWAPGPTSLAHPGTAGFPGIRHPSRSPGSGRSWVSFAVY
jgi:hypothetical protein